MRLLWEDWWQQNQCWQACDADNGNCEPLIVLTFWQWLHPIHVKGVKGIDCTTKPAQHIMMIIMFSDKLKNGSQSERCHNLSAPTIDPKPPFWRKSVVTRELALWPQIHFSLSFVRQTILVSKPIQSDNTFRGIPLKTEQ